MRDYTAQHQILPVIVEESPVYELILSLFVWGGRNEPEEYEAGSTFFERMEQGVDAEAAAQLGELVGSGELWLPLIGLARSTGTLGSVESLIDYLKQMDPVALRGILIDGACSRGNLSDEDASAAASGQPEAIARFGALDHVGRGFHNLIEVDGEETKRRIIATLETAYRVLEPSILETLPALRRDAEEKRSLSNAMDAPTLVETATNGITFRMEPQIYGVLLIPSKIIRPWNVITEHDGLRIFAYGVADEHLQADPDAPPSYLVDVYKALGDERRLRMLGFLSRGDAGLMDIAQHVGLAKSTAHHHLRILRTAGLIRITVGESKAYSLRRDGASEATRLLEAYLATPAAAEAETEHQNERN
ncbi:MAG: metalloregulator ArsR/SmtB family transcription factor [Acidimicrobiia bacterium]|nr:metalloregulator ArsR/SmtB family transcription factor [Acidimicrobiia bacterium]